MEHEEIVWQITNRLDKGFEKLHEEVDSLRCDFTQYKEISGIRFNALETEVHVRAVKDGIEEKAETEKKDWGKWAVRGVSGASAMALMLILWKLLTGAVKIIEVVK